MDNFDELMNVCDCFFVLDDFDPLDKIIDYTWEKIKNDKIIKGMAKFLGIKYENYLYALNVDIINEYQSDLDQKEKMSGEVAIPDFNYFKDNFDEYYKRAIHNLENDLNDQIKWNQARNEKEGE